MAGTSMKRARNSLQSFLRSLLPGSRFNIVSFGSRFELMFSDSVVYNQETFAKASSIVSTMEADFGGTELAGPLSSILASKAKYERRSIILLTDGDVHNQSDVLQIASTAVQTDEKTRVFTLGIGSGTNKVFLQQLALRGHGVCELSTVVDTESAVASLLHKVFKPMITNIEIELTPEPQFQTVVPEQVFSGESLSFFALYPEGEAVESGTVTISYVVGEQRCSETVAFKSSMENAPVYRRLASVRLLQEYENGLTTLSRDEALHLALCHSIVSSMTSLVGESEEAEFRSDPMRRVVINPSLQNLYAKRVDQDAILDELCDSLSLTRSIMMQNIGSVLERGESIEELVDRTDTLESASRVFHVEAASMSNSFFKQTFNAVAGLFRSTPSSSSLSSLSQGNASVLAPKLPQESPLSIATGGLYDLIKLQRFDGSFCLTEVCLFLGQAEIAGMPDGVADLEWGTALALAILQTRFSEKRKEWQLIFSKGLELILKDEGAALVEAAAKCIVQL